MAQVNDLSRSLASFEQSGTLVVVLEMSQSSWLAAGVVPGVERRPLKKISPDPATLLHLLERWRDQAVRAGQTVTRAVLAFEAGRDGFWLARWLRARGIETYVVHSTSVAVSREHRRAKTDRLDTEMLIRVFLEYDFVVAPGANPQQIRLQFEGAASLRLDRDHGDLVLTTSNGIELRHAQPNIYQEVAGKKVRVRGGYEVRPDGTAGFTLGTYNPKVPLIIDPTVRFTTFLSGSDSDEAFGVAFDGAGNSCVTGSTDSGNFPTTGGIQGNASGTDAFVTKLSPTGTILFSTYLGGGSEDDGIAVAADASGVYVTGRTASSDFPVRQPLQPSLKGDNDAFVTKLSPLGNTLVYSTFLGGAGGEEGWSIAVDASQSAYSGSIAFGIELRINGELERSGISDAPREVFSKAHGSRLICDEIAENAPQPPPPCGKKLDDALDRWALALCGGDLTKLPADWTFDRCGVDRTKDLCGADLTKLKNREELLPLARKEPGFSRVNQQDIRALRRRFAPKEITSGGRRMHARHDRRS